MPLIDVVFLLLTFFIFALVLMVRADLMDIRAPGLQSGRPAAPGSAITVVVDAEGEFYVDGEAAAPEELIERIEARRAANPEARLFVAADEESRSGALLDVIDRLMEADLGDFSIVGRPSGREE